MTRSCVAAPLAVCKHSMDGVTCPRHSLGERLALEADSLRLLARGSARRVADCFVRALGTSNRILHHGEMGG